MFLSVDIILFGITNNTIRLGILILLLLKLNLQLHMGVAQWSQTCEP